MRRALELLVNRLLRSRLGLALLIAALVLAIIGIGQAVTGGAGRNPVLTSPTSAPTGSEDPREDDSIIAADPPAASPTTRAGTAAPEAVAAAFAAAWVDHEGGSAKKWYAGLLPHMTKSLAGKLSGVDPDGVPAERVVGRPSLVPVGEGLTDVVVAVDSGQLRLRLVAPDGKWLVDGVDWERG